MLYEHALMNATKDNYENLMWAVIYQACQDYCGPDNDSEWNKGVLKFLLDPENPYLAHLQCNGKDLVKKMNENYRTYGKCMLSPTDLEELKDFGRILSPQERQLIRKSKKKRKELESERRSKEES